MDNIKPWQIILIVLAVLVLGFSVWQFAFKDSIPQTDGYLTVDIMTGQLYDIRKGKARGIPLPARHPDTGERTLYPVNPSDVEENEWVVPSGFDSYLTENVRKGSKLDDGAMTITALPEDPIRFILVP